LLYLRLTDELNLLLLAAGPRPAAPEEAVTGFNHMCITVSDIGAAAKELEARGIRLMHPLQLDKGLDGNRGAWVADPDGNRIELMEMSPDCVQYEAIKAWRAGKGMTSLVRPLPRR
jgi:lactoylglutathione lyase